MRCVRASISGLPMMRASGALHSSVAVPSASFQIPSLAPFDDTYSRYPEPNRGENPRPVVRETGVRC